MALGKGRTKEETCVACKAYTSASKDFKKVNEEKKLLFAIQILEPSKTVMDALQAIHPLYVCPDCICDAILQRFRKSGAEYLNLEGIVISTKARKAAGSPSDENTV